MKIDTNIPIPASTLPTKYGVLAVLKPGESVRIDGIAKKAAYRARERHNKANDQKVVVRKEGNGYRFFAA